MKAYPVVAGLAATALACSGPARRWYLTGGATAAEVTGRLAGDELVEDPDIESTRAISIDAPPVAVRPWSVQRGSAYRLLMEPGSLIVERRMLHGIGRRAQGPARTRPVGASCTR